MSKRTHSRRSTQQAKMPSPIQLTEIEFWQLKARAEEAMRTRHEADSTPQAIAASEAKRRVEASLRELTEKYGFDPRRGMTLDEPTLSLIVNEFGEVQADTPTT